MHRSTMAAAAMVGLLSTAVAGCTGVPEGTAPASVPASVDGGSASPSTSASPSASTRPLSARELCEQQFGVGEVRAWAAGTVEKFRAFQYGGPVAHKPLADAFPGIDQNTLGAWCDTDLGTGTDRWWAVVDGSEPVRVIDLTGPSPTGEVAPPVIP